MCLSLNPFDSVSKKRQQQKRTPTNRPTDQQMSMHAGEAVAVAMAVAEAMAYEGVKLLGPH